MWEKVTKDGAPGKVLLVHHEWHIARLIATNLTRQGHHVVIVESCERAEEKLSTAAFTTLIVDAALPPGRCAAALERLKQSSDVKDLEIFILGANESDLDALQKLDHHPIHILGKKP